jgi:hypothetical protein
MGVGNGHGAALAGAHGPLFVPLDPDRLRRAVPVGVRDCVDPDPTREVVGKLRKRDRECVARRQRLDPRDCLGVRIAIVDEEVDGDGGLAGASPGIALAVEVGRRLGVGNDPDG